MFVRKYSPFVAAFAFVLTICASATADPEGCHEAVDQFKSARSEVADGIRAFASCISSSDGHDDCSSEFSRLRSAEDDFESAMDGDRKAEKASIELAFRG